jgi:YHS domain-containing protein
MVQVSRRNLVQIAIATVGWGACAPLWAAQRDGVQGGRRVAISGYDPVAYFTDGRPIKGSSAFSVPFDEAEYYFISAEHQKMFAADPDRYAPQFSGYCAVGVYLGHKAEVNPEAWTISNGKLYLFHYIPGTAPPPFDDAPDFREEPAKVIVKANVNWSSVKHMEVFDHNDETDRAARSVRP